MNINFKKKSFITFINKAFYEILMKIHMFLQPNLKLPKSNFSDIVKLFTSQYSSYNNALFLS